MPNQALWCIFVKGKEEGMVITRKAKGSLLANAWKCIYKPSQMLQRDMFSDRMGSMSMGNIDVIFVCDVSIIFPECAQSYNHYNFMETGAPWSAPPSTLRVRFCVLAYIPDTYGHSLLMYKMLGLHHNWFAFKCPNVII